MLRYLRFLSLLLALWATSASGEQECKTVIRAKGNVSHKGLPDHFEVAYGYAALPSALSPALTIHHRNAHDYPLKRVLGRGASAEVHLADCRRLGKECVVKVYTGNQVQYDVNATLNEVLMLQTVCGGPNVMKIYDVIREKRGHLALILEYVPNNDAQMDVTYHSLTPAEVQFYMREFLRALAHIHALGIIHRDIKPPNVLIDRNHKMLRLIDFGLAVFHDPEVMPAGPHWWHDLVAPEFFFRLPYDSKLDIWAFGYIFATLITRKFQIFSGRKHDAWFASIIKMLGSDDLVTYLRSVGREPNVTEPLFHIKSKKTAWTSVVQRPSGNAYAIPEALDLIGHLLR